MDDKHKLDSQNRPQNRAQSKYPRENTTLINY